MRFMREGRPTGRGFVLLAPSQRVTTFDQTVGDPTRHRRLLQGAQRLRGRIYVQDGAIEPRHLTADLRHVQPADAHSWHLLGVDERERVTACIRYYAHRPGVSFSELSVSRSAVARSPEYGPQVREAVEAEIQRASHKGVDYVEIGGWAISEELRCTPEALQMLLSIYALAQLTGGALGLSTATTRHHSSSILRRVGGSPLMSRSGEVRAYYDPQYGCEMELLGFDSDWPSTRYSDRIHACRAALLALPVVSPDPVELRVGGLLELHVPLSGFTDAFSLASGLARTA